MIFVVRYTKELELYINKLKKKLKIARSGLRSIEEKSCCGGLASYYLEMIDDVDRKQNII